jgi:cellulose synthase/poly-beta-1,6-N-acetylglucosamine synthase-like glycosyltransferase
MSDSSSRVESTAKVSIVIPAYNEEKYIRKSLAALTELQQTSPIPVEIIVCDNGSTDNTVAAIQEFPNVILQYENVIRGANAARQGAFKAATGNFIAAMDADCAPEKNWIPNALHYFNNPRVVSVAGVYIYESNFWFAPIINYTYQGLLSFVHYIAHNMFKKGGIMLGGNAFYRRDALEKIGGFATDIPFWGDDAHTADQLAKLGKIVYALDVAVVTSSRRFTGQGTLKTLWLYIMNWIWIVFTKKPFSKTIDSDVIR